MVHQYPSAGDQPSGDGSVEDHVEACGRSAERMVPGLPGGDRPVASVESRRLERARHSVSLLSRWLGSL